MARAIGWIAVIPALCATVLAGFPAVGPDYHGPPAVETPVAFKNGAWKPAEPRDAWPRGDWWRVFDDPVLDRVEEQAVGANQDIAMAVDRIAEVQAGVRVAAADFFPNIEAEPNAVRERLSNDGPVQRGELVGNNPFALPSSSPASGGISSSNSPLIIETQPLTTTYHLFNFPLDLNWELDLFGRVRRNREAARATAQAAVADYDSTLLSVTANVASTYYGIRATDAEMGVLEHTIATREDGLGIAKERLNAGLTSELDVTRAEAELADNQADLYGLQRSRQEMEDALATLLGCPASDFRLARRALIDTRLPNIPPGLPSSLLERRPDVASAERQLAADNARIGVAVAAFFPVIQLTGAAGFESADAGDLFAWQSRIWQIGPSITLPIFEGGRNMANLRAAQARYREQVDTYREQVLTAFQDVESALGDLHTLSDQSDAQERAISAAVRSLELSNSQYGKGAVNYLDVLDAQRTLLSDERTSVQLLGQKLQATVLLIKALGGSW
ncbi:MAG: efflux transporter outer membrane subunit [Chthoniobacteraceae bacterium]